MGQYVDKNFQFIASYIVVCALLLASQALTATEMNMIVNTNSSSLALRGGAGTKTSVKCRISKDTLVTATGKTIRKWVEVSVPGRPECGRGWMWRDYLINSSPVNTNNNINTNNSTMVVNTSSSSLALRSGAGTGYQKKCSLPKGTRVIATGDASGGWVKVSVPGRSQCGSGWMWGNYLKELENVRGSVVINSETNPQSSSASTPSTSASNSNSTSISTPAAAAEPYSNNGAVSLSTPICECQGCVMTSDYGPRYLRKFQRHDFHHGHDYGGPVGTPAFAMADAKVVNVRKGCNQDSGLRCNSGLGNNVTLKIEQPIKDLNGKTYHPPIYMHFMHLRSIDSTVKEGDSMKAGMKLGSLGNTGYSTGPHLDIKITKVPYYSKSGYISADYQGQSLAYDPSLFFGSRSDINSALKGSCPEGYNSAHRQQTDSNRERSAQ